jgi:hypothetical protein
MVFIAPQILTEQLLGSPRMDELSGWSWMGVGGELAGARSVHHLGSSELWREFWLRI